MPSVVAPAHAPCVSVVIPTFQRAAVLREAIRSALVQREVPLEVLVVDDGSTDQTPELLAAQRDERLRWVRQENRGQAAARNRGIALSRAPWVAFLDSDNLWPADRLARQFGALARAPDVDVVYGISLELGGARRFGRAPARDGRALSEQLLDGNFVPFNTSLVRREALRRVGGFDETLRSAEDYDLWLRLSADARFLFVDTVCAFYRISPDSISSDLERNFLANERIVRRFLATHPRFDRFPVRQRALARLKADFARQWCGRARFDRAFLAAVDSCLAAPWRGDGPRELCRALFLSLRRVVRP